MGIFRALTRSAGLDVAEERQLLNCMQRKAADELDDLLGGLTDRQVAAQLRSLIDLNGGEEVLAEAAGVLAGAGPGVEQALADLQALIEYLRVRGVSTPMHFDLAELKSSSSATFP